MTELLPIKGAGAMRAGERVRVTGMQGLVLTVEPGSTETSGG